MAGTKSVDLGSLGRLHARESMRLASKDDSSEDEPDFLRQLDWAFGGNSEDGEAESPSEKKPLILSVDDDEVNHMVIKQHLGGKYRIVEAVDGYEALTYLRSDQDRPICVLLDLMMPGITGLEVVQIIREELKLSHAVLPVIILSARSPLQETAQSAFDHGATDFMAKPFNGKQLAARLRVFPRVRRNCLALHRKCKEWSSPSCQDASPATSQACDTGAAPILDTQVKHEDELRKELASAQEETAEARKEIECLKEQLQRHRHSEDELRKELASAQEETSRELARLRSELASAKEEASRKPRPSPRAMSVSGASVCSTISIATANRELRWLQSERKMFMMQLNDLVDAVQKDRTEAHRERVRANALAREVSHLKEQLADMTKLPLDDIVAGA